MHIVTYGQIHCSIDVPLAKIADLQVSRDAWGTVKTSLYLGSAGAADMMCFLTQYLRGEQSNAETSNRTNQAAVRQNLQELKNYGVSGDAAGGYRLWRRSQPRKCILR